MQEEKMNGFSAEELDEIKKSQKYAKYGIFLAARKETLSQLMKELENIELNITKNKENADYYRSLRDNEELVEMLGGEKAVKDFQKKIRLAEQKIAEFEEKRESILLKKREVEEDIYQVLTTEEDA